MNPTPWLRKARRTLLDPLGVLRFNPDLRLEPEDLPGFDRVASVPPATR